MTAKQTFSVSSGAIVKHLIICSAMFYNCARWKPSQTYRNIRQYMYIAENLQKFSCGQCYNFYVNNIFLQNYISYVLNILSFFSGRMESFLFSVFLMNTSVLRLYSGLKVANEKLLFQGHSSFICYILSLLIIICTSHL